VGVLSLHLVIDANQAAHVPQGATGKKTLTLSPYILAEILLYPDPKPTLLRLSNYQFRIGLELDDVFHQVLLLPENQIASFEPFLIQDGRNYVKNYSSLKQVLSNPISADIKWAQAWAKDVKDRNRFYSAKLYDKVPVARRELKNELSRRSNEIREKGEPTKLTDFRHVIDNETVRPDSAMKKFLGLCSNRLRINLSEAELTGKTTAASCNQYLRRYNFGVLAYGFSVTQSWADQTKNFTPSYKKDDLTDLGLLIYTGDGDILVTADTKVRTIISCIEVDQLVVTRLASEID